jgi:hypothetical protein
VDRRLTVTGIFLLRFRGEQIGSPPTDVFPDKPNKNTCEPKIKQSGRDYLQLLMNISWERSSIVINGKIFQADPRPDLRTA